MNIKDACDNLRKIYPNCIIHSCLDYGPFYLFVQSNSSDNKDIKTGTVFDAIDKKNGNHFFYSIVSDIGAYRKAKEIDVSTLNNISHSGVAHDHNPPGRGSGRYPFGSGKRPFQGINFGIGKRKNKRLDSKIKRELTEDEKEKIRQKLLKSDSATEVLQYRDILTNEELLRALNRIKWTTELKNLSENEKKDKMKQIDSFMNTLNKVNGWTNVGITTYNNVNKIIDIMKKEDNKK